MMKTNSFVYINSFEYLDEYESNRFYGHPKTGGVYKALKQKDVYKIPLRSKDGIAGIALSMKDSSRSYEIDGKWKFSLSEITEENLIDFDLKIEDLHLIEKEWNDDYDPIESDIEQEYEYKNPISLSEILQRDIKIEDEIEESYSEEEIISGFSSATHSLNILADRDVDLFKTVVEIIEDLAVSVRSKGVTDIKTSIIKKIFELKDKRK